MSEIQKIQPTQEEKSFALIQRQAMALSESELIPKRFHKKVADCVIGIEMAQRLNTPAMMVMQNIYIVHGTPGWSGQFVIAIINASGRFKPLKFHYSGEGDNYSCIAYTSYLDDPGVKVKGSKVDISMAKQEGWFQKSGSKWQTMPEQMLAYRAAAFFGRIYCPDLLMGMQTVEEIEDINAVKEPEKPKFSITKESVIFAFNSASNLDALESKRKSLELQAPELLKDEEVIKALKVKRDELTSI